MSWSPASCTCTSRHSSQAAHPSRSGILFVPSLYGRVRHSGSIAGARPLKRSARNSCERVSRLALKAFVSRIAARVADARSRPTSTIGGFRESGAKKLPGGAGEGGGGEKGGIRGGPGYLKKKKKQQ